MAENGLSAIVYPSLFIIMQLSCRIYETYLRGERIDECRPLFRNRTGGKFQLKAYVKIIVYLIADLYQ